MKEPGEQKQCFLAAETACSKSWSCDRIWNIWGVTNELGDVFSSVSAGNSRVLVVISKSQTQGVFIKKNSMYQPVTFYFN